MKFSLVAAVLNIAAVQAVAIPAEAAESIDNAGPSGPVQINVPKMMTPKYRPTAKRAIIRYPAFTLQAKGKAKSAMSMDPNGQSGTFRIGAGMCSKCTLLSAHYRLVSPEGNEVGPTDGVYIHHMTSHLSPKTSENPISGGIPSIGAGAYFIDRGEDSGQSDTVFTSADGRFESGYQITGTPSVSVSYDFVNYKDTPRQLHLELEYEWLDGIVGKDAGHTLKTVAGNPKLMGKSVSTPMRVSKDTTIMWARGHLHQGGVSMTVKVNGAVKCVSNATYDTAGVITSMSLCPKAIDLKKGDSMTIESDYDTNKHKLREASDGHGGSAHGKLGGSDVMGMVAMSYTS
ncbi:hypothetical protein EJ08DRAFT_664846 [Tothia fuscella]|uniref:Uncharacterized protein n=1 Tax=Tothia fuscella TaxID=1048955 RepID=A0A9P4TU09_9PEZI|nr:hypothetical protein EJ08DRAFT_664846 [Tothia fuscella]